MSHQRTRQKRAAGATKLSKEEIAGKIVEYTWFLKKAGYSQGSDDNEGTIQKRTKLLKRLVKLGANLYDPEDVKKVIANTETWSVGCKINAVYAYQGFVEMEGLTWTPPKYARPQTLPFVPYEEEIDQLIHACGKKVSIFLQGLKETGVDPGELKHAEWIDINEKARTLSIRYPVKGHKPRILPISRALIDRFHLLPKVRERIFPMKMSVMHDNYLKQRKRIARKLDNPRLVKVTFTSVRHWKATMEYHKTRSILHVKELLGHRSLKNTMVYIDIERALYGSHKDDEFISRAATSLKGARALIEAGFEYVTDMDGYKLFRRRK